ncbi:MAG: zinc ABC transporter substrate-binding protein [Planctomycetaceae bacterium]|nr:zinc ABC transporter substrate-binding protein [Planctomycetaceae bacterium]
MTVPKSLVLLLLPMLACVGCGLQGAPTDATSSSPGGTLKIVATTGHIADAVRAITEGTDVELTLLCGPGVDPHSYSASTSDVAAMAEADLIVFNGFHLEARLHDLLEHEFAGHAFSMANSFPSEARLDWVEDGEIDSAAPFDPHIWNHLPGWSECVAGLVARLQQERPANSERYQSNGQAYLDRIEKAHEQAESRFASIPPEQRVLVSAHDAFNYFASVYGFETVAVLGVGNDAEADIRTMREVAEIVCDRRVPVIFVENITNPKVTQALREACSVRDWSVRIAERPLYSDDLGAEPPANTYLGAFQSNVDLITESLNP